jgi:hypothetical protein
LPTPSRGRGAEYLLERSGKGSLGIVSDPFRYLRKRCAGAAEIVRGDLHAPISEIVHGSLTNQSGKAIR